MSPMNPFDTAEHLASLWGRSGDALLDAQRSLVQELAGWMPSVAPERATGDEGYEAARRAFARSWETALDVSRTAAANLSGPGDPALATTLGHLLDPAAWFAQTSGREPGLGDVPATTSLAEAATLVQRRSFEHDVILVEAWMQAAGAFARALHAGAEQGMEPASPESVTALWSEHADPIFAETERSDAFRRSRDRLTAARAGLDTAQRAVGQIYGYATHRDLDELRRSVEGLRRQVDEATTRPEPAPVDRPVAATPIEVGEVVGTDHELADTGPRCPPDHDASSTAEPMETPAEAAPRREISEPPPRYVIRSAEGGGPVLLLVGPPDDVAMRDVADSISGQSMTAHEVVWSEAAWQGSLDGLVRDLATALTSGPILPVALVGVGPGAIPLACLASRRDLPALVLVDAAFAFDVADLDMSGPDWLGAIQRDNALMRGTLTIEGEPIDLAAITCPVLNFVPRRADGPAEGSRALAHLVAGDEYAEHRSSDARKAGPAVAKWLTDRHRTDDTQAGTSRGPGRSGECVRLR